MREVHGDAEDLTHWMIARVLAARVFSDEMRDAQPQFHDSSQGGPAAATGGRA